MILKIRLVGHSKLNFRRICKKTPKGVPKAFGKKYLDDAMGKCNEMIVNLEQSSDIYKFEPHTMSMEELIDLYDKSGRQLYNLSTAWTKFKSSRR